jgi:hypothetical protein
VLLGIPALLMLPLIRDVIPSREDGEGSPA